MRSTPMQRLRAVHAHLRPAGSAAETLASPDDAPEFDRAILAEGHAAALALDNRGPLVTTEAGLAHIAAKFEEHGFYVLQGAIGREELDDLRQDIGALIDRAPAEKDSELDKHGRPAEKAGWNLQRPLSDPNGGRGRSEARGMREYTPDADAPASVVMSLQSYLPHSEAALRLYAHPGMLALAAAVNGPDFCPFSESIQIKFPRLGPAVTWHQDGTTHWDKEHPEHGFNFMCQLYTSTAENGVWAVPKTHRQGKIDIIELVQQHGDRLPGAVPMVMEPGDVCIANRNVLHGSFPNVSPDLVSAQRPSPPPPPPGCF